MSRKTPQFQDKPSQQRENVLKNATKPGQTIAPERKMSPKTKKGPQMM
jgi:hypothetical protein